MFYKQKKTEKIKSYRKYKYNTCLAYVPYSFCFLNKQKEIVVLVTLLPEN